MSKKIFIDFYEFLEVKENATIEEIHKAYKRKIKLYHPDNLVGKTEEEQQNAKKNYEIAQEAYDTLSNPNKKKIYDLEWKRRKQSASFNKNANTQASSSSHSSTNQTQYREDDDIAFDGTFAEYAEFMRAKRRQEEEEEEVFSNSSKNTKSSKESKKNQKIEFDEYLFHFFKSFYDMNFTDKNTDKKKNYKFYRQKTSKSQKTKFEKKHTHANDTSASYTTFTQECKMENDIKPDFSEVIELDKILQTVQKQLSDLISKESRTSSVHNTICQRLNNLSQHDIKDRVTGNSDYQRAKEYIEKHNQRANKFITKLFISKKDWNTYFEMQNNVENMERQAHEELRDELLNNLNKVSKELDEIRKEMIVKENEIAQARKKYQEHPLHFKYECKKMNFTKKYETKEETTDFKKVI